MLSFKFLTYLHIYFRFPAYFHSIPWSIRRDPTSGVIQLKLRTDLNRKDALCWALNLLCQLETVTFSFLRFIYQILNGRYTSIDSLVMHSFNIIGWGMPVYYSTYILFYKQEITQFFNQVIKLDKWLRDKYYDNRPRLNILEQGFIIVLPSCYLQGICFCIFSLFCPHLPFFHCSFLREMGWPIWAQIPVKVYECAMLINCWNVIAFIWLAFLSPAYSITGWTQELKQSELKGFKHGTLNTIRKPENSIKLYVYLELVSARLLELTKNFIFGASFFVGSVVVVFMGYASVRELGGTGFPQYLAYPTSWMFVVLIFEFTGSELERWNVASISYIRGLRTSPNKTIRRQALSFRALVLKIFSVQEVTRGFTVDKLNHACDSCDCIIDLLVSS